MQTTVRVRDIARKAGVSVGAVSRALNSRSGLSDETRQRIMQIAQEMGYDFSRLHNEKIKKILFILHRQHNTSSAMNFYSPVLLAVEDACRERHIALSFLALGPTDNVTRQVLQHAPDALLCVGFIEPELMAEFRKIRLPMALVDHALPGMASINPDNYQGGMMVTNHLINQGYKRIAFLASSLAHYSIRQRERGYRQALFDAGILMSPQYEVTAPALTEVTSSLEYALDELMSLPEPPDALFCYNDAAAIVALNYCQKKGIKIPTDLAIAGFDDIELSTHLTPPLTTLSIDKEALGRRAVEHLVERPATEEILLPVKLIIRGST
ncbi:LacI family DNA-binding transcriptional regulator [Citrobacter amalonaticus]|uniref:LacI family DNA-binding transcriptional regulator n=1 Tax=Citrobacter amalonaticus TaxID=35703 RepID=UPI0005C83FDB|nr:LacI family DNA-binding transcriptional regulator [Citrobacter amalonaticus]KKF67488.1 LacI family transcriptional regulator [Vibrio parahaemolyticus]EKW5059103.1 LacI family DNA-binding transcriptional regulator [Citrobacter amalonaticus]ELT8120036.1 LacI family DNA-binding transcriptional regulator [Citrobacter amalonaticus]KKY42506.1 LacI family transcriptional regulator [Vibrio parahaemolyticus]KOP93026.1 LacI family transcriptional regulator [Citrobacter amalonaticus]